MNKRSTYFFRVYLLRVLLRDNFLFIIIFKKRMYYNSEKISFWVLIYACIFFVHVFFLIYTPGKPLKAIINQSAVIHFIIRKSSGFSIP